MNEEIWRSKPNKKTPKGERWRFLSVGYGGFEGFQLMMRVKDGHRLYVRTEDLKKE